MLGSQRAALLAVLFCGLAGAAQAAEPVPLAGRLGGTFGRLHASVVHADGARESLRQTGSIGIVLGPFGYCGPQVVSSQQFRLHFFTGASSLSVPGSFLSDRGRAVLEPDPDTLRDRLAESYAALCAASRGAEACTEALAGLEPRLGRARVSLAARRQRDGVTARLRARFELAFVDPETEEQAIRMRFALRDAGPLRLPAQPAVHGVCVTVFHF